MTCLCMQTVFSVCAWMSEVSLHHLVCRCCVVLSPVVAVP